MTEQKKYYRQRVINWLIENFLGRPIYGLIWVINSIRRKLGMTEI